MQWSIFNEEDKLQLADEVSKQLPAFKSPQVISHLDLTAGTFETRTATCAITIRQLLTHTSDIRHSWSDTGLANIEKLTGSPSEVDAPLVHESGEKWIYGAGPKVLGLSANYMALLPDHPTPFNYILLSERGSPCAGSWEKPASRFLA